MLPGDLRARRLAAGWSKQQLATKIGVPVDVVSAWENGEQEIQAERALAVVLRTLATTSHADRYREARPPD